MAWSDFDEQSAVERDIIARALPLVPLETDGSGTARWLLSTDQITAGVRISEIHGTNAVDCIKLLGLRPLLMGAAWKVLDLLIEEVLEQAGRTPEGGRHWRIEEKTTEIQKAPRAPGPLSTPTWSALRGLYVRTAEIRHSLTHRTVSVNDDGALVGFDRNGGRLRPLTPVEQDALGRAVIRAAAILVGEQSGDRALADLDGHLAVLNSVHRVELPNAAPLGPITELTLVVDRNPESRLYEIDFSHVRRRNPFPGSRHADLILEFPQDAGRILRGRLEDAPDGPAAIDPGDPPAWLL
jgi:hypothetical protein